MPTPLPSLPHPHPHPPLPPHQLAEGYELAVSYFKKADKLRAGMNRTFNKGIPGQSILRSLHAFDRLEDTDYYVGWGSRKKLDVVSFWVQAIKNYKSLGALGQLTPVEAVSASIRAFDAAASVKEAHLRGAAERREGRRTAAQGDAPGAGGPGNPERRSLKIVKDTINDRKITMGWIAHAASDLLKDGGCGEEEAAEVGRMLLGLYERVCKGERPSVRLNNAGVNSLITALGRAGMGDEAVEILWEVKERDVRARKRSRTQFGRETHRAARLHQVRCPRVILHPALTFSTPFPPFFLTHVAA